MCSDVVIEAAGLSKCYHMYEKPHERLLQSLFRGKKVFYKDFWAVRDVSFKVRKGETIGIVGRNGSGKTSLLQLIAGTLLPTQGRCNVNGRIAALLALGAGFNPEYTGEENIYLYASLLGLNKHDIQKRYDSIIEFADIGEFISQPVNKYSSGMHVRLAFSVAIHVEPDILIVDEALAVGDEAFQRKCYARLEELKKTGMSLLFVSHSAGSVINLCDRALLIDKGKLIAEGKPKAIIGAYHKLLFSPTSKIEAITKEIQNDFICRKSDTDELKLQDASKTKHYSDKAHYVEGMQSKSEILYESKGAIISEPKVTTLEGEKVNVLCKGETYNYVFKAEFKEECYRVMFGMMIKNMTGIEIGGCATSSRSEAIEVVKNGSNYDVVFSFVCRLNPGVYFLNAGIKGVVKAEEVFLHRILDAIMIRVMPEEEQQSTGIVDFEIQSNVKNIVL